MKITYSLTLDDYRTLMKRFTDKNPSVKLKRWVNYSLPPLAGFVASIMSHPHSLLTPVVIGVLVAVVWGTSYQYIYLHKMQKVYKQSRLDLSRSMTLTDQGLHIVSAVSDSTLAWGGIVKIYDDSNFLYFMMDKSHGIFVPKSAFTSSSEAAEFLLKGQSLWYEQRGSRKVSRA